ncbi:uncharacterized protein DS421_5g146290 [Arachis hypogaea]|nr:uncharacterized protein DS421_5g146290 [Arachis hypogaea]
MSLYSSQMVSSLIILCHLINTSSCQHLFYLIMWCSKLVVVESYNLAHQSNNLAYQSIRTWNGHGIRFAFTFLEQIDVKNWMDFCSRRKFKLVSYFANPSTDLKQTETPHGKLMILS